LNASESRTAGRLADARLAIVSPMANERDSAVPFVQGMLSLDLPFAEVRFLAILDRASTDGTRELLERLAASEPRLRVVWAPENRGVVDAYVRGYREALATGFEWILEIDAGFSHRPEDFANFLPLAEEGHDCVFGSRFMPGGCMESTRFHYLVSRGGTWLANLLLGTRLSDMTSGYQLFRAHALREIVERGIRSRGRFFQTEMKTYCRRMRIAEAPIRYRSLESSAMSASIADALRSLLLLILRRLDGAL